MTGNKSWKEGWSTQNKSCCPPPLCGETQPPHAEIRRWGARFRHPKSPAVKAQVTPSTQTLGLSFLIQGMREEDWTRFPPTLRLVTLLSWFQTSEHSRMRGVWGLPRGCQLSWRRGLFPRATRPQHAGGRVLCHHSWLRGGDTLSGNPENVQNSHQPRRPTGCSSRPPQHCPSGPEAR